ncbi:ribonucleases P/MRP protein subunit POP1 [Lucilia sericata]|uniref:ribonucleases P/MRP protein subunit POP1 n=1 Tax=Lucilia sericata TaxID=13632 RepID=UPI0018A87495|nr:ribonucleases P/MRP protein subunit POP1 [Lucilia sericata]
MVSKKLEYDSSLGGPVVLGTHMPTYKYAASALKEVKELVNANKQSNSNKLVFQTLPKHMRRRAMSHHPKRLPRKYRAAHIHQMSKSGKPQATKRPSRKHRRRPQNLLKDYLRRQRKHKWLETHIWHAKRFHMIEKWGYKLPYASCDKTFRACYRATAEHCLLQDISFYACVELKGSMEELAQGFQRLTSQECGLSLTAKTYLNGRREGCIDVFKADAYPYSALGKVRFLWRFEGEQFQDVDRRTLWLWLHPGAYNVLLEEIIKVFDLKSSKTCKVPLEVAEEVEQMSTKMQQDKIVNKDRKVAVKIQRRLQFMTRTTARENIPHYKNITGSVELKELKNTLNRFRLTGPLAQAILNRAFKVKSLNKDLEQKKSWVNEANKYDNNLLDHHEKQQQFWTKCQDNITSPSELLSNMVLALNIEDPRIHRPQKRSKAVCEPKQQAFLEASDLLLDVKPELSSSALWCDQLRNRIVSEMLSTHEYCSLRAKHVIVPGKSCQFEETMQPVPIILIQRPGSQNANYKRLGYGCGWDIIAPAGYGMSIWLSLIMWGARAGGLREFDSLAREMGTEEHLPDTVAGLHASSDRYNELFTKYFRLPPNKRCNYRKFAIVSPFRIPFQELVRDWRPPNACDNNKVNKEFFVLRERQKLQDLAECVKKCSLFKFPKTLSTQCLIQVKLIMKSRGNPKDFSVICLPTKKDLKRNLKQIKLNNREPVFVEPLLADPNEKERHQLRMQHKKLLKRLRAKRVREKRKKQETSSTRVYIRAAGTSTLCLEQFKKMCQLWLPQDTSTLFSVRKQGTRECFGYCSISNFCLTEGTVGATAYITVEGLKHLLKLCQQCHLKQPVCLVRSANSRNYRFAQFQINLDV